MCSRAGLDGRKISSPLGFDPGSSRPWSVAILTELPGPPLTHTHYVNDEVILQIIQITVGMCKQVAFHILNKLLLGW